MITFLCGDFNAVDIAVRLSNILVDKERHSVVRDGKEGTGIATRQLVDDDMATAGRAADDPCQIYIVKGRTGRASALSKLRRKRVGDRLPTSRNDRLK